MIDEGEARRIAVANLGGIDDGDELLLDVYEDAVVARGKPNDERDEERRLTRIGQGCIVIDRSDGKVYNSAYVGPETVVFWREDKAAGRI